MQPCGAATEAAPQGSAGTTQSQDFQDGGS